MLSSALGWIVLLALVIALDGFGSGARVGFADSVDSFLHRVAVTGNGAGVAVFTLGHGQGGSGVFVDI